MILLLVTKPNKIRLREKPQPRRLGRIKRDLNQLARLEEADNRDRLRDLVEAAKA